VSFISVESLYVFMELVTGKDDALGDVT